MKKKIFLLIILTIFIIFVWFVYIKYVSTKKLEVREYKIVNYKLTDDYYGLKIIHFGDIHYGSNIKKDYLDNILTKKSNSTLSKQIYKEANITKDEIVNEDNILKEESKEKLEAIGLIKTYVKKGNINNFVYELFLLLFLCFCIYRNIGNQRQN